MSVSGFPFTNASRHWNIRLRGGIVSPLRLDAPLPEERQLFPEEEVFHSQSAADMRSGQSQPDRFEQDPELCPEAAPKPRGRSMSLTGTLGIARYSALCAWAPAHRSVVACILSADGNQKWKSQV
jgi:hypothetical protein